MEGNGLEVKGGVEWSSRWSRVGMKQWKERWKEHGMEVEGANDVDEDQR